MRRSYVVPMVWGVIYIGRWGARRGLKSKSTNYPDHGRHRDPPPTRKIPMVEPVIEPGTSLLIVRSSPLDHEAGHILYWIRSVKCLATVVTREYVSDIECCYALLGNVLRKVYFICTWTQHVRWQIMHRTTRAHFAGVLLLSVEITSRPVMDGCEVNWKCLRTEAKFISFTSWNPPRTFYVVVMYDKEYAIRISERNHCHNTPRLVICFSWAQHCTNLSFNQKILFLWQCYMSLIFPHCFFFSLTLLIL